MTTTISTTEEAAEAVLKTDNQGRVRVSRERRAALLEEFDRSGATVAAFSRMCGVNYQTFAGWVRKRRRNGGTGAQEQVTVGAPVRFAEVMMSGPVQSEHGLDILLPCGARWKVGNERQCDLTAVLLERLSRRGGCAC